MILYGKDVDVMKRKIYRIKLWIDKINFCKWDVYAKDNMEAQSICEHLKECCIKNGIGNNLVLKVAFHSEIGGKFYAYFY